MGPLLGSCISIALAIACQNVNEAACEKKSAPAGTIAFVAPDLRARVEYYRAKVGPAWRFELPGTPHRFSLYGDCERKLTPVEAVGSVK